MNRLKRIDWSTALVLLVFGYLTLGAFFESKHAIQSPRFLVVTIKAFFAFTYYGFILLSPPMFQLVITSVALNRIDNVYIRVVAKLFVVSLQFLAIPSVIYPYLWITRTLYKFNLPILIQILGGGCIVFALVLSLLIWSLGQRFQRRFP